MATDVRTVMTAAVWEWTAESPERLAWVIACRSRHHNDDWGDLDHDDRAANTAARRDGEGRLFSVYRTPVELRGDPHNVDDRLWIITDDIDDPDGHTTILWPSDY